MLLFALARPGRGATAAAAPAPAAASAATTVPPVGAVSVVTLAANLNDFINILGLVFWESVLCLSANEGVRFFSVKMRNAPEGSRQEAGYLFFVGGLLI